MQRFIVVRLFHSVIALIAVSMIIFGLGRLSGNPLDTLLDVDATADDYARVSAYWGLDQPLHIQFAPRALRDGQGRRIMFANLNERRPAEELVAAGWSGCMSLPVELTLAPGGQSVRFAPVAELRALRHRPSERANVALAADAGAEVEVELPEISGAALELELQVTAGSAGACGLKVRCSPDGAEETAVALDAAERAVEIEFGKASRRRDLAFARWDAKLARPAQSAPLQFDPARPATLRVFVDHSVVEVFAGAGAEPRQFERFLAQRIYPTRPDALQVKLFSRGGAALAHRVRSWRMRAV